jgi:transaldolase
MKFFIDTAKVSDIREAHAMGLIDGVTTNPSLLAKAGGDETKTLAEICSIVTGPVSAEVIAVDTEGMLRDAHRLAKIAENIVVKIPLTVPGLKATRALAGEGISVNATLCFNAVQALLAAKAGAAFVSPFVGRLDDIATGGMEFVRQMRAIFDNYGFATEVIVASIRNPLHVLEAALMGADAATIPPEVLFKLAKHPLTDIGLERFLADHEAAKKS